MSVFVCCAVMCVFISACRSDCYGFYLEKEDLDELVTLLRGGKDVAAFFTARNYPFTETEAGEINLSDGYPLALKTDENYSADLYSSSGECVPVFRVLRVRRKNDDGETLFESVVFIYRDKAAYLDQRKKLAVDSFVVGGLLSPINSHHLRYLNERIGLVFDHPRLKVRNTSQIRSESQDVQLDYFAVSKEPEANGNETYFISLGVYRFFTQ